MVVHSSSPLMFPDKNLVVLLEVFVSWYLIPSVKSLSSHQAVFDDDDMRLVGWEHLDSVITDHHLCHNNHVMRVINSLAHVNFTTTSSGHQHHVNIRERKYHQHVRQIFVKYVF